MNNIALLTSLFDYPAEWEPSFYKNASKYFDTNDIHISRNHSLIKNNAYYDKLYFYKIVKNLDYINEHIKNKYKYILFLDATDTNFITDPSDIITKFHELNCSIVMGAEKGLWPLTNFTYLYDYKPILTEYKYLNSGTYLGYTDQIIYHLENIICNNYHAGIDDQGHWTIEYLLCKDILIDQQQNFFFSTYQSKNNIHITNKDIILKNSSACIIHDNGGFDENTIKLTELLNENN